MEINNVTKYLIDHGVRPSYQRVKVFEYLIKRKNHPTVYMIYKALVKKIPSLSKSTVYNTLNLFVKKKIVIVITIEDNETRYDADTSIHGHFKCEKCGKIFDFEVNLSSLNTNSLRNIEINEHHIYFKGICHH